MDTEDELAPWLGALTSLLVWQLPIVLLVGGGEGIDVSVFAAALAVPCGLLAMVEASRLILRTAASAEHDAPGRGRRYLLALLAIAGAAPALVVPPVLCGSIATTRCGGPYETTVLTIGRVEERVQIFMVKKKRPPTSLAEAYGSDPVPADGWGRPLAYVVPGPNGAPYDIVSYQRDAAVGCYQPPGPIGDLRASDG